MKYLGFIIICISLLLGIIIIVVLGNNKTAMQDMSNLLIESIIEPQKCYDECYDECIIHRIPEVTDEFTAMCRDWCTKECFV